MTTGPILGTSQNTNEVYEIARAVGFNNSEIPFHKESGIRLQIHGPAYFKGIDGVVTEIEFDDVSERFPKNPEAIKVLGEIYIKIPDLQYYDSNINRTRSLAHLLRNL